MDKLWLIFKREYLSRVTKKTFILATILTPLGIGLLVFISGYMQMYDGDKLHKFAIVDEGHFLKDSIGTKKGYVFDFSKNTIAEEKEKLKTNKAYEGIVLIDKNLDLSTGKVNIDIITDDKLSFEIRETVQNLVADRLEAYKMAQKGISQAQIDALNVKVKIATESVTEGKSSESSLGSAITTGLGFIMGFVMYITLFIYGMMVMRSVQEEKTSRIVEVMISSVRPFELMLGKILGVAAVALTQLSIWVVLTTIITAAVGKFFGFTPDQSAAMSMNPATQQAIEQSKNIEISNIFLELGKINWWFILPLFITYFVCGYLLYSSLFAAVGSAVGDDVGESQALTMPITIPIILAIYIMMHAVRQPDSTLSIFASIFPLFSPIVMPARLGFNPPVWQIVASIAVLIGSTIFFIWLSGRI
jgi:ABC-2 type transport system permease protein